MLAVFIHWQLVRTPVGQVSRVKPVAELSVTCAWTAIEIIGYCQAADSLTKEQPWIWSNQVPLKVMQIKGDFHTNIVQSAFYSLGFPCTSIQWTSPISSDISKKSEMRQISGQYLFHLKRQHEEKKKKNPHTHQQNKFKAIIPYIHRR